MKDKTIYSSTSNQIAYPVGEHKDSYNIESSFRQNTETNELSVIHKAVRNPYSFEKKEGVTYKEGTRFREQLCIGTYDECYDFINKIVEKEGLWTRDEKLNYVHSKYSKQ